MLRRLNIRSKLLLTVALPLLLLIGVGMVALPTFQTVKVNGPAYRKIKDLENLRADVRPPAELLLEAHLLSASLLLNSAIGADGAMGAARDEMARLETNYRSKHDYWAEKLTSGDPHKSLLTDSFTPADAYFQTVSNQFLPLLDQAVAAQATGGRSVDNASTGPLAEARAVFRTKLEPLFRTHRAAVDGVATQTEAALASTERATNTLIARRLIMLMLIVLLAVVAAAVVGTAVARAISSAIQRLTDAANAAARDELPRVVSEVQDGKQASIVPVPVESNDELGQLAEAFNAMQNTAVQLAAEQARVRKNVSENLVNLGRRNQVLLGRTLSFVTQLEESERDPKRLDDLFRLDHLTTRMRRNAESLLVLAGAEPPRMWSEPVEIGDVARAALSEIEDYRRVELTGMEPALLQGAIVSDVAHLLAELCENATSFSAPTSKVSVLGKRRSDGYLMVIVDEGFGMPREELEVCNHRLAEPATFDSSPTKVLGLHVVGKLAQRHGIRVELTEGFSVGTAARVLLPDTLFDSSSSGPRSASPATAGAAPTGDASADFEALFNVPFGSSGSFSPMAEPTFAPKNDAVVYDAAPSAIPTVMPNAAEPSKTLPTRSARAKAPADPSPADSSVFDVASLGTALAGGLSADHASFQASDTTPMVEEPPLAEPKLFEQLIQGSTGFDPPPAAETASPDDAIFDSLVAGSTVHDRPSPAPDYLEDWLSDSALASATGPLLGNVGVERTNEPTTGGTTTAGPTAAEPLANEMTTREVSAALLSPIVTFSPPEGEPVSVGAAESEAGPIVGLRRRVPGAQLPDTGPAVSDAPEEVRDPGAVRAVLGGLQRGVEGARRANDDPKAN